MVVVGGAVGKGGLRGVTGLTGGCVLNLLGFSGVCDRGGAKVAALRLPRLFLPVRGVPMEDLPLKRDGVSNVFDAVAECWDVGLGMAEFRSDVPCCEFGERFLAEGLPKSEPMMGTSDPLGRRELQRVGWMVSRRIDLMDDVM